MVDIETEKKDGLVSKIEFKGVPLKEIDRYAKVIQILIASGGLDVKSGKTILNWQAGFLDSVDLVQTPWKRIPQGQ